ncbi:hypothetical protein TWF225_005386 [Orbilia oligospora]|nr:hypothetical protein TWF225_005386 [Orbilia oligospora]KAF3257440.1 hypothetical protein TWF128_005000 [Orbilia oligospora]KAF3270706.1 hypothetical protein TWF217_006984 [Orbilia oligospora]KAF3295277.1 hypothetical protein TWF132_001973 [Orbilia oligospora]
MSLHGHPQLSLPSNRHCKSVPTAYFQKLITLFYLNPAFDIMAAKVLAFDKCLELAVFAVCATKLAITIAIFKQKTNQMTLLQTLEFASSTLTDWMWTIIAAYVLLHYIGYGFCANPKAHRWEYASSTSSISSRSSLRSVGSIRSRGSGGYYRSINSAASQQSHRSIRSRISQRTSTTIVRHRTNIPNPMMERFMMVEDFQFEADMGRLRGTPFLDSVTRLYLQKGIPHEAGQWA